MTWANAYFMRPESIWHPLSHAITVVDDIRTIVKARVKNYS